MLVCVGVSASIHDIVNKNSYIVFEKFICVTFISGTQSTCTSVLGEVSTDDTMACSGAPDTHTRTHMHKYIHKDMHIFSIAGQHVFLWYVCTCNELDCCSIYMYD